MESINTNGPLARADCRNENYEAGQAKHSNSTDEKQALWVPVSQAVTCKRCGRANLAWQQSRSGKWYLVETRRTQDGKIEADRREFHKCQPAYKNAHGVEVSDADLPF